MSSGDDDDSWTLLQEFWYHCGTGGIDEVNEIVSSVADGRVPLGFESELLRDGRCPYTVRSLVEFQDEDGSTPSHAAAANNHVIILQFLHDQHKAPFVINRSGNSPLHWAAQNGCVESVEWLLERIADIDVLQRNAFGKSAVSLGFESQNDRVVTALLSHSSADKLEPRDGETECGGVSSSTVVHAHPSSLVDDDECKLQASNEFENISEFRFPTTLGSDWKATATETLDSGTVVVKTREFVDVEGLQQDVFNVEMGHDQTGSFVWESSVLCALWMLQKIEKDPSWIAGKVILEAGAGCGLPIMSIAKTSAFLPEKAKPKVLIASDFSSTSLANLRRNLELNDIKGVVQIQELNWLDSSTWHLSIPDIQVRSTDLEPNLQRDHNGSPIILVGSDLIYDELLVDGFVDYLHHLLDSNEENCMYLTLEEHRAGVQAFRQRLNKEFSTCEFIADEEFRQRALKALVLDPSMPGLESPSAPLRDLANGTYYMITVQRHAANM